MDIMQALKFLQASKNPAAAMQQMAGNNPLMQRALAMGQGKSEDEVKIIIKNLANQRGIDVDQLNILLNPLGLKL